jgi:predicted phosphodiesterase
MPIYQQTPRKRFPMNIKIALIGDVHVGLPNREELLPDVIQYCNTLKVELVVFLGDLVHEANDKSIDEATNQLKKLEVPFYVIVGNHDVIDDLQIYREYFYLKENHQVRKPETTALMHSIQETFPGPWSESFTYAAQCGEWNFIFAGYEQGFNPCEMKIGADDFARLEGLIQAAQQNSCLFIHTPIVPVEDRLLSKGYVDQGTVKEADQLRGLLETHPRIKAVFSGHHHFNQVSVVDQQLHCVTQFVGGLYEGDGPAIRVVEFTDNSITSNLQWPGSEDGIEGEIGTSQGDRNFVYHF